MLLNISIREKIPILKVVLIKVITRPRDKIKSLEPFISRDICRYKIFSFFFFIVSEGFSSYIINENFHCI